MKRSIIIAILACLSLVCLAPESIKIFIMASYPIIVPFSKADIQYKQMIEHLGLIESGGDYTIVNAIGCIGKWQFSKVALEHLGYGKITVEKFIENPSIFPPGMQEELLRQLFVANEKLLKKYMHFIGTVIYGVKITKSGMLAAAHLGGHRSVKRFLDSAGKLNAEDMNKTSILCYMKIFSKYKIA